MTYQCAACRSEIDELCTACQEQIVPDQLKDSPALRLRLLLETAGSGDVAPVMRGIGISQRGKIELFSRLAYIAGIKRALEIVEEYEKEKADGGRQESRP